MSLVIISGIAIGNREANPIGVKKILVMSESRRRRRQELREEEKSKPDQVNDRKSKRFAILSIAVLFILALLAVLLMNWLEYHASH